MEFLDLVTFSTVAKCGGITAAATALRTVQSNVTNRVRALEAEVGMPLFERHSRGMTLTDAGLAAAALCRTADRVVARGPHCHAGRRRAERHARDRFDGNRGGRPVAAIAGAFSPGAPGQLTLRTGPTAILVDGVLDGTFDGAFVCGPIEHPDLFAISTFREELVFVSAAQWKTLAALRKSTAAAGPTALVFRTGCSYRQRLEQILAESAGRVRHEWNLARSTAPRMRGGRTWG